MQGEADGGAQTTALREKKEQECCGGKKVLERLGSNTGSLRGQAYLEEEGSGRLLGRQECTFVGMGRWCGSGVLCEEGQDSGRQAAQSRNVLKGEPGLLGFQSVCLGPPELGRWKQGVGVGVGVRGKSPQGELGREQEGWNKGERERLGPPGKGCHPLW